MLIEQRFELPLPPAAAWPAFCDLALLVECLPGAALTGPQSALDGDVPLRFDVRLGPIAAGFVGTCRADFDHATHTGRFEGAATDRKTQSRVKGHADFGLLASASGGSVVSVNIDYALSGSLAQFGRVGIVRELANALTAQFAANLAARLQADGARAAALAAAASLDAASTELSAAVASPVAPARPAARPLALGALLRIALRAWLGRLLGSGSSSESG